MADTTSTSSKPEHGLREVKEASTDPRSVGDALRAVIAGGGAARAISSGVALFEAGGKHLLDEGAQGLVRSAAEKGAESALAFAAGPLLGPAAMIAKTPLKMLARTGKAARAAGPIIARSAGKEIFKGAGKAAGIGFLIDGAVAGVEAVVAVRNGSMDRKDAVSYVAKEAATGAVATGAGVLVGAGLVILTGGIGAPVVFAVGALGSIGTKRLLRRFTQKQRQVAVREVTTAEPAPST
jgi:hypothetical protein